MQRRKSQILQVLAKPVQAVLQKEDIAFDDLQEIRMRIGQPLIITSGGHEIIPSLYNENEHIVTKEEIRETLEYISHYSLYAYEHEMRQGFITIEGGHRVGVSGKAIIEGNSIKNMHFISSINIRVSHEVIGCSDQVLPYITANKMLCHTLIVSPPRCGKTTLIRDLIRQISNGNDYIKGCTVGVVDERSELGGCYMGVAQNQLGMRTDILDCCPKAEGMIMLIRSMSPQVIAVDEIGTPQDVHAIEYAMHCGCKMLASVHGDSMEEIQNRPVVNHLMKQRRFERYVLLSNQPSVGTVKAVFDERGSLLYGTETKASKNTQEGLLFSESYAKISRNKGVVGAEA
ncbi:MAG: stage III sporulation protein AA [Hespellia sp.]|nr:stage III sporulation protein AA [Hespellia sp.]